jgi:hypothetical protein
VSTPFYKHFVFSRLQKIDTNFTNEDEWRQTTNGPAFAKATAWQANVEGEMTNDEAA